ncbi:lysM and putative peptidoglycan-binding domain-containing protein 2 isoform X1 [Arvicanthis niloticus]|uniref:lysM and putative peptidoglycan-binding domain-containing protein 2 isoform X1 n=1 Tax=Arvicanthis niloticus TaxID=61156 RepID=UPI00402B9985
MGPRTPPWASVGPQASAHSRFRRAISGRTRTLQPGLSSLIPTSTGTSDGGGGGKAGLGEPRAPCRSRSSPPRPRACRPRGTASRSPSEEEEAEEEAPPPWRARHPGGLGRTHGGSLACAGPAGRRPPCAPALGALPSAALPFRLGARGGRAVAEPGPHQDPLVRQHGQRAGASGRRRHRAPCGAPGPRRGHASGHRAQVWSYENETVDSSFCHEDKPVVSEEELPPPSPQDPDPKPAQPEEVSARDFLQRLDLQIKLSTQAARKLKEENRDEESPYAASLYHS